MTASLDDIDDALVEVARAVRRHAAGRINEHGIAMHQVRALRMIGKLGTPRIADLAEQMNIAARSVTEVIDHLAAKDLVTRSPNPDDRRSVVVELTATGTQVLRDVIKVRRDVVQEFYGVLGERDRRDLLRLLRKIAT